MKIVVETQELKDELIAQSKYVHDYWFVKMSRKSGKLSYSGLDSDKAGILMHIYTNPDLIVVENEE
jgi:hypothetical protein